jgi:hypothetical protein
LGRYVKVRAARPLEEDDSPPRPAGFFGACLPRRRQGTPLLPTLTFDEMEEMSGDDEAEEERESAGSTPGGGSGGGGGGRGGIAGGRAAGGGAGVALSPVVENRAKSGGSGYQYGSE